MPEYKFVTIWRLEAGIDAVWDALYYPEHWPTWWPNVAAVEKLAPGDTDGVGAVHRYTWKTSLPYTLGFTMETTRVERPNLLEGRADGELTGVGRWALSTESGGITTIRYDWNVRTTKAWMNLLAPIARPLFAWNHDRVMEAGGKGLAQHLNARLLES